MKSLLMATLLTLLPQMSGATTYFNVNTLGIVSGNPTAAAKNTKLLQGLVSPKEYGGTSTFTGSISFPDSRTYYFSDVIVFKDNISVDLSGSTLNFHKTAELKDQGSGFIFALRNFSIENGTIQVDYNGTGFVHAGNAIYLGQRYSSANFPGHNYYPKIMDSTLTAPLGNITVTNVKIISNNPTECGIQMLAGLTNVVMSGVSVDGQGRLPCGIYYEFGQATAPLNPDLIPKPEPFYTSHAHAMRFTTINVTNLSKTNSIAFGLVGAYDTLVDGLTVNGAFKGYLGFGGEAAFYKPWGTIPSQRWQTLRNITMTNIYGTPMDLSGSARWRSPSCIGPIYYGEHTCGYLGKYVANIIPYKQTHMLNYDLNGFFIAGNPNYYGIITSGGSVNIQNGRIFNSNRGIVATDDTTTINIYGVGIYNFGDLAINLNFGNGIVSPPYLKRGSIKGCVIKQDPGNSNNFLIALGHADPSFTIQDNLLFSYNQKTIGQAILMGASTAGVKVINNQLLKE